MNGKGHGDCANYQKRRTDYKPDQHCNCQLQLVDVVGHPRNQRRRTDFIKLFKRKCVNMCKQRRTQLGSASLRGNRRAFLANQRACKPDCAKQQHYSTHFINIRRIPVCNARVNDTCHNKRHNQLKNRFEQLAKGPYDQL